MAKGAFALSICATSPKRFVLRGTPYRGSLAGQNPGGVGAGGSGWERAGAGGTPPRVDQRGAYRETGLKLQSSRTYAAE